MVLSPDSLSRKLDICDLSRAKVKPPRLGRGVRPCPDFALYTLAFTLQLRQITENPQSGYPKGARQTVAERDSSRKLGHRQAMAWTDLLAPAALEFASGDGVNPRSA